MEDWNKNVIGKPRANFLRGALVFVLRLFFL